MEATQQQEPELVDATPVDVGRRIVVPDEAAGTATAGGAFYAQFLTRLGDSEIEALEAAGVLFGQTLGENTYVVLLDDGGAGALAAHPSFVGLTPVVPEDKAASDDLLAVGGVGQGDAAPPVRATVEFFPGVTLADALAATDDAGVLVLDRSSFLAGSRLAIVGSPDELAALAAFPGALYLNEEAAPDETHNLLAQQLSNVDDVQAAGLTGAGVTLGIWDGGPVLTSHSDFGSRVTANDFTATLSGSAAVPGPGDTNGIGSARISLQGTSLVWSVSTTNIAEPTATHIHSGGAGQAGGIYIALPGTYTLFDGTYYGSGTATVTTSQAAGLRANPDQFYVNVHNAVFPDGAIRGQFEPSDFHATHVGGTMIGSGAGNAAAEGMAPGVPTMQSYDFQGDIPSEMTYAANSQGVVATNNSFGTNVGRCDSGWCSPEGNFGLYNFQARDWDAVVVNTGLINVKSSGNDRDDCGSRVEDPDNCDGFPATDGQNYDNISTYGNAKNVITVGAVNDDGTTIASFSSAGPANDGRIKPDVVANGVSVLSPWNGADNSGCAGNTYCSLQGTSMSTPVVTGIVALMEQRHIQLYGSSMPAPVAKAALANTATDLGRPGPDYLYGYGLVDAQAAVDQLALGQVQLGQIAASASNDPISQRDLDTYTMNVTPATADLRVSLNWIDPAGVAQSDGDNLNPTTPAIVNQLDLVLVSPNGTTHYPFKGPGRANPTDNATASGPNRIDTLQQVRVSNPEAGSWAVIVRGWNTSDQDYALATSEVACSDDDGEDGFGDDEWALATEIAEGQTVVGEICNSDVDYFRFPVAAGEEIIAEALFAHADGDLDIRLYDPSDTQVSVSNGTVDNETITYTALVSGDYRVRVEGWQAAENSYSLTVFTGACPRDDTFEDNDDQASATSLGYGSEVSGIICGADADWYTFSVIAGDEIFARALFTHPSNNNINMRLFDPGGSEVANAFSLNNNEAILHTALTSGNYAVRVYGFAGAETLYDFSVWNGICAPDDPFETNDTQATAATLPNGSNVSAILCDGDDDWFRIYARPGELITVDAMFDHARGDLDMKLFDPNGVEVATSGSETDNESITHTASMLGNYGVRIRGFNTAENIYDLTASSVACPPDDPLEDNDTQATATALTSGVPAAAVSCAGDLDWFDISVGAGESITIDAVGTGGGNFVSWDLYDPNGDLIDIRVGNTHTPLLAGDYAIEVFCCGAYEITVTTAPVACPADDAFEENDSSIDATAMTNGAPLSDQAQALLCEGDEDWYQLPVTIGAEITIEAIFTHANGDINIELIDPDGATVETGDSETDNEMISHTATMTGDYEVFVLGSLFDVENEYDLTFTAVSVCPPDDMFEENDTRATAALLTSGEQISAARCGGDDDWYRVPALAGHTITADAVFTHALGDLEIDLFDPDGFFVEFSDTFDDDESLTHQATKNGDYALRVSAPASVQNRYDLTLTAGFVCPEDDAFEDNDSQGQAELVGNYSPVPGIACGFDADWFELDVFSGERVIVDLKFTHADGDLVLELYDPNGGLVGTAQTLTDNEGLSHTAAMTGAYAARVSRATGPGTSYELTMFTLPVLCPTDDPSEDNDTPATATPASFGFLGAVSCPGDDDWYVLPVAAGEQILAELDFSNAAGDLSLSLFDPTLMQVGLSDTEDDREVILHTATMTGDYFIQVPGLAENEYGVSFSSGLPGLTILDDPCVLYDSDGAGEAPFIGGETRDVQVTGELAGQGGAVSCVPAGASSVVFRVSSIDPSTEGNLRMWAAGNGVAGGAGVVNYGANALNNANTVTVPVSAAGSVTIEANAGPAGAVPTTDVRLVAIGFYQLNPFNGLGFVPVNPCAVADSRPNKNANDTFDGSANDGFWSVGDAFPDVDVVTEFDFGQGGLNGVGNPAGNPWSCGVPFNAEAVMVNVVAIAPTGSGFLSVGSGGTDPIAEATTPFAALSPGMANGATTIVRLNGQDKIAVDIDGEPGAKVKVRVEILGYYVSDGSGADYSSVSPCTAFDSRSNKGATGSFAGVRQHGPGNATVYQVAGDQLPVGQGGVVDAGGGVGSCGVPDGASAVLMNFEAVNAVREGNFWVSAGDQSSTGGVLNFNNLTPKMNNANAVVVPLDALGRIKVEVNAGNFTPIGTDVAHARGIVLGYYD